MLKASPGNMPVLLSLRMYRKIDILVLSDLHLGSYGCRAVELLSNLWSISPGTVILNGDIIDIWQFKKRYFPKSHMQVVKRLPIVVNPGFLSIK